MTEQKQMVWKRRADAALEAMVLRAMERLDVELARHLVANALTPYVLAPDDPELPELASSLREVFDRCQVELAPSLLRDLVSLWERAHLGEDVSPGILAGLRAVADSGGFSEHGRARAASEGRTGTRSDVSLEILYERGFWTVWFCSPSRSWYAENGSENDRGRVLARGVHPMLEVAAELCRRALFF